MIYTTVEMYRKDGLEKLKVLKIFARTNNLIVDVKLVQGAYIEKENQRASTTRIESPICHSKKQTDLNFHKRIKYIIQNLDYVSLYLGTHNERNIQYCIDLMSKYTIEKSNHRIWFSQLYGISNHVTYGLSNQGFKTVKYIPYGPRLKIVLCKVINKIVNI